MAKQTGISYETLNTIAFIILGPLATLFFLASTLSSLYLKGLKRRIAITVFVTLGTIAVLGILIPTVVAWWGAMQIWHSAK